MKARKQLQIENINYIVRDTWYAYSGKYFARIQQNVEITKEQLMELSK